MICTDVESSALRSIGYDAQRGVLEVEFASGSVYEYSEVPPGVYQELMSASSHGRYFDAYIRDRYPYSEISG